MSDKEGYPVYGVLNEAGKVRLGDIFPDDRVPIKNLLARDATLVDVETQETFISRVYMLDLTRLSIGQKRKVLDLIEQENPDADVTEIVRDTDSAGVPIREQFIGYTCSRVLFFL